VSLAMMKITLDRHRQSATRSRRNHSRSAGAHWSSRVCTRAHGPNITPRPPREQSWLAACGLHPRTNRHVPHLLPRRSLHRISTGSGTFSAPRSFRQICRRWTALRAAPPQPLLDRVHAHASLLVSSSVLQLP
jgi:hypothetical protein